MPLSPRYRANYPQTVTEVLDDSKKYKPESLRVLKVFRRLKPWRGTDQERRTKLQGLHLALCRIYRVDGVRLTFNPLVPASYTPLLRQINLPTLSVVTYLHEFAHARGADERMACRWSINLFRRIFPRSYARCRHDRHMLVRPR